MNPRSEVARICRRLWRRGLVRGSSGNVSVRVDKTIVVTPAGACLGDLHDNDLVVVDASGRCLEGHGHPTSELPLHLAAYRVRDDIACVVHTHPTMSVVWSKTGSLPPRDTVGAMESLRPWAFVPYIKNGTQALADASAEAFGNGADIVMMADHGISVVAPTLAQAFVQTELADEAAAIAWYARDFTDRS